ncbi:hypothetical protein FYL25_10195 [Lactobacillus salivarius]|uniref:Uncharacterized protein n=1 Tax=Ligilactobacillus salivarius TaxID=1624 RepID=A0A6N9ITU8_9LACO|nr:hypothetical protein [Ligilactobacillus salivarius]MYY65748.1 hypothetical protein [Ligilactobacillus salivarius]
MLEKTVKYILDKLDKANVTCIDYAYYIKDDEMFEDSYDYCDEFDKLYDLLIFNLYVKHGIDPYDDSNSFNKFKKENGKWVAEWFNPMELAIKVDDILNNRIPSQVIEILEE